MDELLHQVRQRLDARIYDQLKLVAKTLEIPMNKLAQRAIADDLKRKSADLAKELSPRLEKLRRYAESPTGLDDALQAFVDGEARHAKDDPAEGRQRHVSKTAREVVARGKKTSGGVAYRKNR